MAKMAEWESFAARRGSSHLGNWLHLVTIQALTTPAPMGKVGMLAKRPMIQMEWLFNNQAKQVVPHQHSRVGVQIGDTNECISRSPNER